MLLVQLQQDACNPLPNKTPAAQPCATITATMMYLGGRLARARKLEAPIVRKKIQDGSICLALCALEHCGGRSLFGTSSRPHCGRLGSQLHSAPCELDENLSLVKRLRCRTLQKMQAVAQFPHVCFESNGSSLSQAPKDPFLLYPFVIFRHSFKSMQGRLRPSPWTLLHQQKNIYIILYMYIYICCRHLWRCLKLFEKGSKPPHWALVCFGWFSGAMSEGPLCWSKIIPRGTQNTFLVSWIEVAAYAMLRKQEFDWSGHIVGLCAMRCKNL